MPAGSIVMMARLILYPLKSKMKALGVQILKESMPVRIAADATNVIGVVLHSFAPYYDCSMKGFTVCIVNF